MYCMIIIFLSVGICIHTHIQKGWEDIKKVTCSQVFLLKLSIFSLGD